MHQLEQGNLKLLFKLIFMKLLMLTFLFIGMSCFNGCKTGGKWVSSNSTGVKIISPKDSLSDGGVAPEKPKINSEDVPVINKPKNTTNKTVSEKDSLDGGYRSKPEPPKNSNPENSNLTPKSPHASSSGETEPFKPSENIIDVSMNLKPNNPPNTKGKVDKPINNVIIEEDMKIDWAGLLLFYFIAVMALIITWMLYDLAKDFVKKQKEDKDNPFNVKNPTTKKRTRRRSRKRVTAPNKK